MENVQVNRAYGVRPEPAAPDLESDLQRARQLANLLDARFEIAGIKVGMDSIVGLIPGVGDVAMTVVGLYPLYLARRHGLGRWVTTKMAGNLAIDFVVGAIPLAGDVFDLFYKANLKNLALLEKAAEARRRSPDGFPQNR
jgi:hypothetical protein